MDEAVYVVLFRGINVGGRNSVKMEALRGALSEAGFSSVETYIQSGNVVLKAAYSQDNVTALVEDVFLRTFGFTSRVTVHTSSEIARVIERNPFPMAAADPRTLHAILFDGNPREDAVERLDALAAPGERFAFDEGVLYLFAPDGIGRSKLAAGIDRTLGVPTTARNWRTIVKLDSMARKAL